MARVGPGQDPCPARHISRVERGRGVRVSGRALRPEDARRRAKTHALPSDYPIRTLTVTYTAKSQTPAPPLLRLELVLDGQSIATSEPASGGELVVENLPAGRYELRVHADQAVLAEYEARAVAPLVLEAPVRAEGGDHGMHGGGPINPCDPNPIPPPGRDEAMCREASATGDAS